MGTLAQIFSPSECKRLYDNVLESSAEVITFEKLQDRGFYIFGCGLWGRYTMKALHVQAQKLHFEHILPIAFIDSSPLLIGSVVMEKLVMPLGEANRNCYIIVTSIFSREMAEQCKKMGFKNILFSHNLPIKFCSGDITQHITKIDADSNILDLYNVLADETSRQVFKDLITLRITLDKSLLEKYTFMDQYFPKGIVEKADYTTFIDCGTFDGDTLVAWDKYMTSKNLHCGEYHGFEPVPVAFAKLQRRIKLIMQENYFVYNFGLSDVNKKVLFSDEDSNSTLSSDNKDCVQVELKKFDDIYQGKPPTFFKADIEGAECQMLAGAKHILQDSLPTLAISCYHSHYQLLEVPNFILENISEHYRIYVRHHSSHNHCDTVCYALMER